MHGVWIPGYQRVPPGKIFAFMYQAVGTGWRQPFKTRQVSGRQLDAIGHTECAFDIIGAAARSNIQQSASDIGMKDFIGIFVFKFVQTAFSTPVAERLPFVEGEFCKGLLFPEGGGAHGIFLIICRTVAAAKSWCRPDQRCWRILVANSSGVEPLLKKVLNSPFGPII